MPPPPPHEQPSVTYIDYDDYDVETACCLDGDVCHVYLNWQAAANLQLVLFGLWTEYDYLEDKNIFDEDCPSLALDCASRLEVCSIVLISDDDALRRQSEGIGRIKSWTGVPERVPQSGMEFYLTRAEMKAAFLALRNLMEDKDTPGQAEVFNNLVLHYVPSKEPVRSYFEGLAYRLGRSVP